MAAVERTREATSARPVTPATPEVARARPAVAHEQPPESPESPVAPKSLPASAPPPPSRSLGGGGTNPPPSGGGGATHLPVLESHFCGAGQSTPAQRFTHPNAGVIGADASPASG